LKRVYLGLGSNLGDREKNLRTAIRHLNAARLMVDKLSPIYETEPEGVQEQGLFLNAVVEVTTELRPLQVLTVIKKIEALMKRTRTIRNGPRVIDIDILFYQSAVIQSPELTIPHPRFHQRRFVLAPLADLAPNWRDPVSKKTITELLATAGTGRFRRL